MAKRTTNDDYDIFCSFCGRYKDEVGKLIAGPNGIFICEDCIDICNKIIINFQRMNSVWNRIHSFLVNLYFLN